uniref:Lipase_3 domain-containing protein n=1 Tax=Syphacia muris TaxID=451379 RepID=A0A0N5AKT5_9BILA
MKYISMLKIAAVFATLQLTHSVYENFFLKSTDLQNIKSFLVSLGIATDKALLADTELATFKELYDAYKSYSNSFSYKDILNDLNGGAEDECSEDIPIIVPFNDTFSREIMHPIAAAAYASDPQLCLTNKLIQKVLANCGPELVDECSGFIALSYHYKAIILSFRGTTQLRQFINQRYQVQFEPKRPIQGGGNVARYFVDAFNSVWKGGLRNNFEVLKRQYPSYGLWITGYSLGGSMAAVAAHIIVAEKQFDPNRITLLTFGETRTGDMEFAEAQNRMLPVCYRVVGRDDIIPHLPLLFKRGYRHYGPEILFQVWYNNSMGINDSYSICTKIEDKRCSTGKVRSISIIDHLFYYQRFIFTYGELGCI